MKDPREKVKTIWISDMSAFTRDTRLFGPVRIMDKIRNMRRLAAPIIASHRGHLFKKDADNLYALFDTPDDALAASLAIHAATGKDLDLCIGIGHGPLIQFSGDDDYYGLQVNLASKLGEDTAGPGETLLTAEAAALLPDDIESRLEGPFTITVGGWDYEYFRLPGGTAA